MWSGIKAASRYGYKDRHPTLSRPLGAYQIAFWLRRHGFKVQVIEFAQLMEHDELVALTEPFITEKTICLGLSRTFLGPSKLWSQNIVDAITLLREKYPRLKVVTGGQYSGPEDERVKVDATFVGYGEDDFLKWCQQQKHGVSLLNPLFDIKELDHRFIPDDVILPGEMLPIELGRGCIFKCKFCSYSLIGKEKGSYLRHHQHLVDEMKYNKDMFGVDKYMFMDDTANEDYDKVARFANFEKDLGFPIQWVGYCRADLIWSRPESAEHLQQSGLVSPFLGIETFNKKAAQYIGKGWSAKYAKDWLPKLYADIWSKKINLCVSMIIGLPYDPITDVFDNIRWWNQHAMGRITFRSFVVMPPPEEGQKDHRSDISKNANELGYFLTEKTEDGFWHWKSNYTTSHKTKELSDIAMQATTPRCRVSSWSIANGINMGYDMQTILNTKKREMPDVGLVESNKVKRRYMEAFSKHFNLPHILNVIKPVLEVR